MVIPRQIYPLIKERLFKGKVIIITGPRQTGKTTMLKLIQDEFKDVSIYLNADEPDIRALLHKSTSSHLKRIIGTKKIVLLDEAQRIKDIGITLKLIADEISHVQLLVTGSSSLEIANSIYEPLTGRKYEFRLFPLSYNELKQHFGMLEETRLLETRLIFGSYPDVVNHPGEEPEILSNLSDSYLYKDILSLEEIRRPELLNDLLQAIALQLGNEVKYSELGETIGANQITVKKYIDLLEKSFVIFRLRAFNRNVRNEIKKSRKIYFYDNGIRNAILRNFSPMALRVDAGILWENYLMSERYKKNKYNLNIAKMWFWRTRQQQEIDLIEELDGKLSAFEFKWNPKKKIHWPKTFTKNYIAKELKIYHRDNYYEFLESGQ